MNQNQNDDMLGKALAKASMVGAAMASLLTAGCGGGGGYNGGESPPPGGGPPPSTITLRAPASATVNRTVPLTAEVIAAAGVTRVEFLVDGAVVGTDTATPFEFSWDTSPVADGIHTLAARVTDAANVAVTSSAVSVTVKNQIKLNVTLTPAEIFPRPNSQASGTAELNVNLLSGAVTGGLLVAGMVNNGQPAVPILAHIHSGYAAADGGVVVPFVRSAADPLKWDLQAGSMLTAQQVTDLLAGKLYVNVHSDAYPVGEIRAQLKPQNINVVFTTMTGAAVRPQPVATNADALAGTTIDSDARTVIVNAILSPATLAETATTLQVREGAADAVSNTIVMELTQDADGGPARWSSGVKDITLDILLNDGWYIDLRTTAHPDGLLRGQIAARELPTEPVPTLSELQRDVFSPRCAGCHDGRGPNLPNAMNLSSTAASFAALVNRPSVQQPNVLRIAPNQPDQSYLVRKLEGTPGITGARMPLGGPFDQQAIDAIAKVRSWVAAGALDN